jgi:hypothetical protein
MNYLFGDSTQSQLTTNFLDFLRDAVDFAVFALVADDRIARGRTRARELTAEAEAETERLERFIHTVSRTIEGADKGAAESATAHCGSRLLTLVADTHRSALAGIQQRLADELARIDAEEAVARDECVKALAALLLPHDPPDASSITRVALAESNKHTATVSSHAELGLDWTIDMAIPEDNLWSAPVHVGRVMPQLEIQAPQLTGWISKEVKIKPQKLDRHLVTELVDDGRILKLKLRPELASATGFDLEIDPEHKAVRATRLGPADDESAGAFEVAEADVAGLVELATKLRAATAAFSKRALVGASTAGSDFREQPVFGELVERLVGMMSPIVHEIAERSRTPNELILRRPLTDDRREEIFLSKAVLRDKWGVLPPLTRAIFAPLGLDQPGSAASATAPARMEQPAFVRTTSQAPPPLPPAVPPPSPSPSGVVKSVPPPLPPPSKLPPPVPPPARLPPPPRSVPASPPSPQPGARSSPPGPQIEVTSVADIPLSRFASEPPPSTSLSDLPPPASDASARPPTDPKRREELVASLKRFLSFAKNGQFDEGYAECVTLFSDLMFSSYRPEEQRQALKLMVIPKVKPPQSEMVIEAHKIALTRLKTLTEAHGDPRDYELLGITHLVLDDVEAARTAFTTALGIERARNPQSELVGTLMKRVSEI